MVTPPEPAAADTATEPASPGRTHGRAFLDLISLGVCLMGLLGLVFAMWGLKTARVTTPRPLFLAFIAMACAPLYVALVRTPKVPYLVAPVVAIFLIYPIANPHGIVYSPDPIFNYSFAHNILLSGFWSPGHGEAFAFTYSYYPIGNVFIGYIISAGQLPAAQAYLWIEPLIRLAAIPAIVYAIGKRFFGGRTAMLALLLYLGTASILFNMPVQQGMGTIFVGLSLLALVILTQTIDAGSRHRITLLFVLMSGAIVMTHHLSSYVFAGWFGIVVLLASRRKNWPAMSSPRLALLFLYFMAALGGYILLFTNAIFRQQSLTLQGVIDSIVAPGESGVSPQTPSLGRTFSTYEIVWLAGALFTMIALASTTILRYRKTRQEPFAVANGLVAAGLTIVTLPLIPTLLNYVPLRISEYTNFVLAPLAAAALLRFTGTGLSRWARRLPRFLRDRNWLAPASAALVCALVVMGANLAPLPMRTYYESPENRSSDSALNIGAESLRAAEWATAHLNESLIWGDQLAVNVYGGLSNMQVTYGSPVIFNGTTVTPAAWVRLSVGDYVVVDRWMTIIKPDWLHEPLSPTPLSKAQVEKFAIDPHFALVYQDGLYSVYRVMSKP